MKGSLDWVGEAQGTGLVKDLDQSPLYCTLDFTEILKPYQVEAVTSDQGEGWHRSSHYGHSFGAATFAHSTFFSHDVLGFLILCIHHQEAFVTQS